MKKIKVLIAFFLIMGIVTINGSEVQAAESRMTVVPIGNRTVEMLSQSEMIEIQQEMSYALNNGEVSLPQTTNASYEPFRYSESFNFYLDDLLVARADAECIVWHYSDGKVHLYQRTIRVSRLITYDAGRTYGRIVNTDGSLSYTTGDRVHLSSLTNFWDFAIDFRVTPTDASFDCYEV